MICLAKLSKLNKANNIESNLTFLVELIFREMLINSFRFMVKAVTTLYLHINVMHVGRYLAVRKIDFLQKASGNSYSYVKKSS